MPVLGAPALSLPVLAVCRSTRSGLSHPIANLPVRRVPRPTLPVLAVPLRALAVPRVPLRTWRMPVLALPVLRAAVLALSVLRVGLLSGLVRLLRRSSEPGLSSLPRSRLT